MYRCTCCGKACNHTTNIFISNNLCDECLDLFYRGELRHKSECEKEEKEEKKEE